MPIVDTPLTFSMKVGTDRTIELIIYTKDDITGVVTLLDVTGWTFYFEINENRESTSHYIRKVSTSPSQIALTAPTAGTIQIYILNTDFTTAPRYNSPYYSECFGVTPGGQRYDIGDGAITFLRNAITIP